MTTTTTKERAMPASKPEPKPTALELLRQPFAPNQIGKLPKITCKACSDRTCRDHQKRKCDNCGNYITTAHIDLDFVGHAALTDRFLDADETWTWEPLAFAPDGTPAFDRNGGLWIRLTLGGVTRLGYGDAQGKSGGNAVKEAIGDALRNAGMRFGAALDLWHKGDLHVSEDQTPADHQERKADRGVPTDDPWANVAKPHAATDQVWLKDWSTRVAAATSLGVLRGLHGEMVEQHKVGKLTDDDRREAEALATEVGDALKTTEAGAA